MPSLPGSIRGVVVDREGTVCEGARIALTLTDSPSEAARTAISDSSGRFEFNGVPVGAFTLNVTAGGFSTKVVNGLLRSGENYQAPAITMLVNATQSDVHVSASQEEIAQAQFHEEEKQRVLGVIPNFYVSYAPNAPPLTTKQKFHLATVSLIDPITILSTGFFAGIEQANNDFKSYGQGAEGYGKRFAANYADNAIGTMIGAAILPTLLKQDPRYFYKGNGSKRSRIFYAVKMSVVCKGDNGRWEPNYSGLSASLASGGISNLYYPAADRNGLSLTFENFGIGIAEDAVQNLFQEFLVRKLTPRLLNYGAPKE
ncbi:MAG: carboxypeptidase-like regulatory domain-containing protein [Terracidiphilus sp.]